MPSHQMESIEECLVTRIRLSVQMRGAEYLVEHGPDDLNFPEESYPSRFIRTDGDEGAMIPAGHFNGTNTVFARTNAFINKFTRKTVPPHHESARTYDGVSHAQATVRVSTTEWRYDLLFDTSRPLHEDPQKDLPLLDATQYDLDTGESTGVDTAPDHIVEEARSTLDITIDR